MTSGISMPSYVNWANAKRFGKMIPYYICDGSIVQQEALEKIVRGTKDATGKRVGGVGYKNFGNSLKQSFLETESAYKGVIKENGSFFKYAKNTIKNLPGEVTGAWRTSAEAARTAGKSAAWAGFKGAGGALLKRLPLIGSLVYCATEIPNIVRATADGGLVSGAAETLKAGAKITGFTAGAAIGQALCPIPIVGAIIGGMVGEGLASLVVGKSYSKQKEEMKQEAKAEVQQEVEQQLAAEAQTHMDTGSTNPFAEGLTKEQVRALAEIDERLRSDPRLNEYQA